MPLRETVTADGRDAPAIVSAHRITASMHLERIELEGVGDLDRHAGSRLWIDLCGGHDGDREAWLDGLGVPPLVRRLCLEAGERPGFYPLNAVIFFVMPIQAAGDGPDVDHVAFLCTEACLLTMHRKTIMRTEDLADLDSAESWLPEASHAGLVVALLLDQSLRCLHQTSRLGLAVTSVEQRMEDAPEEVDAADILALRADLVDLGTLVGDQMPTLRALCRMDRPFFHLGQVHEYLECASTNSQTARDSLKWLDRRIGDLRSAFQMHAQDRTNHRLNVITVLSAVFMPATLLAGIWGMNFESMPELGLPYAYPIGLGCMAALVVGVFLAMRKAGWLE